MRMNTPRIEPLQEADWNEVATALLAPIAKHGRVLNIFRTLAQHSDLARRIGMSDAEILLAKTGPTTAGISELDPLLLSATDELHADAHISDDTWSGLSNHYSTQQLMDLVFTVG